MTWKNWKNKKRSQGYRSPARRSRENLKELASHALAHPEWVVENLDLVKTLIKKGLLPSTFLSKQAGDNVSEPTDRSTNPTVVEYAVQDLFKGKSPSAAAKSTAKKFNGYENMFFGPGISLISADKLEAALWLRMAEFCIKSGNQYGWDQALDSTLLRYEQIPIIWAGMKDEAKHRAKKMKLGKELKSYVVTILGRDPF